MSEAINSWEASSLYNFPNFSHESKVDCKHFPSYPWNPLQALVQMGLIEFLLLKCNVKVLFRSSFSLIVIVVCIWSYWCFTFELNAQYRKLKLIIMPDKMYHRLSRSLQFLVVLLKWFVFLTIMCFYAFSEDITMWWWRWKGSFWLLVVISQLSLTTMR